MNVLSSTDNSIHIDLWMFAAGVCALKNNEYNDAVKHFTRTIEKYPDCHHAYNCRGYLYYMLQEYDNALIDLSASLKLKPGNHIAFHILYKVENKMRRLRYICNDISD